MGREQFKKTYIFVTEQGDVCAVTVDGDDRKHCEGLAHSAVTEAFYPQQVYSSCEYPFTLNHSAGSVVQLATRRLTA